MTVIHTRCCAFVGRKPIQDRGGHVRQLVDMLLVEHVLGGSERLYVLQAEPHLLMHKCSSTQDAVFVLAFNDHTGEEEESIEYLLMPRRRNFDALVRKIGTFHIGNDFVERSQRRFPRLGYEPVQIDAERTPSKGC